MRVLGIGVVGGDDGTLGDAQVGIGPKLGQQDEGSLYVYIIPLGEELEVGVEEDLLGMEQVQLQGVADGCLRAGGLRGGGDGQNEGDEHSDAARCAHVGGFSLPGQQSEK